MTLPINNLDLILKIETIMEQVRVILNETGDLTIEDTFKLIRDRYNKDGLTSSVEIVDIFFYVIQLLGNQPEAYTFNEKEKKFQLRKQRIP